MDVDKVDNLLRINLYLQVIELAFTLMSELSTPLIFDY